MAVLLVTMGPGPTGAVAQTPTPAPPAQAPSVVPPAWRWTANNLTRVESWSFFQPPSTGGDPDYTFVANRLRLGTSRTWSRVDLGAAVQYVQFGGLPTRAIGPGALGTGALYYDHSGDTASRQIYLRTLFVRARPWAGVTLQAGRFGYTSGAEAPSTRPKIEALKRARLDSRMIGEFEWSLYQRAFDGVRADVDRKPWHVTAAWLRPTQGGFEEAAGVSLRDIDVGAATLTLRSGVALPATELALFAYHYDDDRPVRARPDNAGRTATSVDVAVATFGASALGAAEAGNGEADWFVWVAGQNGTWFDQSHRAWSYAAELGYQWKGIRWQPWVRGGYLYASGDDDPTDDAHGTFFPMLPTVRRYAFTTAYAPMNLHDAFVEGIVRPFAKVTARGDVRSLRLARGADRWYSGSGATTRQGAFFGYAGRPSGGLTPLGTVVEGAADVAVARHLSVNGYLGVIRGREVVRRLFEGRRLRFVYLETVIQF